MRSKMIQEVHIIDVRCIFICLLLLLDDESTSCDQIERLLVSAGDLRFGTGLIGVMPWLGALFRSVEVATCIIHMFIQCIELTYIDDLSIALLTLSHLLVQWILMICLW